jgi:hypothetical protein
LGLSTHGTSAHTTSLSGAEENNTPGYRAALHDARREMQVLHKENWTREVTVSLRKFEKDLILALKV